MKRLVFIFFLFFCASLTAAAQTSEIISALTPVPAYLGKFSKKMLKGDSYYEPLRIEFAVKIEPIDLSDGKKGMAVIIQIPHEEIVFDDWADKPKAKINIYARITSKDKTTDGFLEEKINVDTYARADLMKLGEKPVTLRRILALPEGKYRITVIVRDIIANIRGIKDLKFQI